MRPRVPYFVDVAGEVRLGAVELSSDVAEIGRWGDGTMGSGDDAFVGEERAEWRALEHGGRLEAAEYVRRRLDICDEDKPHQRTAEGVMNFGHCASEIVQVGTRFATLLELPLKLAKNMTE